MHRSTLLLDSGSYRNAPVDHIHNVVTNDGRDPAEFRAVVRHELAAYDDVEVRDVVATSLQRLADDTFEVTLGDGAAATARSLVLATGVRDVMPDVPGYAEQWGRTVHMCPFCHAHELHDRRIAVQDSPGVGQLVTMLSPVVASGEVVPPVTGVEMTDEGLHVHSGGSTVVVDGLFTHPDFEQAAPFAAQLDLDLRESGCVAIDVFGHTSVPGVLAAGDLAHVADLPMPMASVLAAAYAGQVAAASVVRGLVLSASSTGPVAGSDPPLLRSHSFACVGRVLTLAEPEGQRGRPSPHERGWSPRYSPGVIPVTVRKSWVKWAWSA